MYLMLLIKGKNLHAIVGLDVDRHDRCQLDERLTKALHNRR